MGTAPPARMGTRPALRAIAMSAAFTEKLLTVRFVSLESHKIGCIVWVPRDVDEQRSSWWMGEHRTVRLNTSGHVWFANHPPRLKERTAAAAAQTQVKAGFGQTHWRLAGRHLPSKKNLRSGYHRTGLPPMRVRLAYMARSSRPRLPGGPSGTPSWSMKNFGSSNHTG
jgi:hypothetical protein